MIVHGSNPFHPLLHLEVAQRYGEAIGERWGDRLNVLGWDWNGDTLRGVRPARNQELAVLQGQWLAEALLRAGLSPERLHLIGHSSGCVVAASAARRLVERTGCQVHRLTLLDPVGWQNRLIFDDLSAGTMARTVEHYWMVGPTGFGSPAFYPNVRDQAFLGPAGWSGLLGLERSDHMHLLRWHLGQLSRSPWEP